jgi:hypothetical protein
VSDEKDEEVVVPGRDVPIFEALKKEIYGDNEEEPEK